YFHSIWQDFDISMHHECAFPAITNHFIN
ncbi:hypothetical protein VCHENC02_0774B, partial [Vibrio harveyi]